MKYDPDVNASEAEHQQLVKKPPSGVVTLTPQQESLHNNFRESARVLKKSLVRTIYYLGAIKHQKIHRMMGFRTIAEYAEQVAGFTPRQTSNFLNLARKLPEFQEVETAVEKGRLTWAQAQEICNKADPTDQQGWVEVAGQVSLKDLRKRLGHRRPPRTPAGQPELKPSPGSPDPDPRHFLSLRLTGEQLARWHTLLEHLMKTRGQSREEVLLEALAAAPASGQPGPPPYLIVILECPTCGQAKLPTNRGELPAPRALLEAARCDATVEDRDGHRRATIPPRLRRLALRNARYRCQGPGCQATQFLEIHHRTPAAGGGADTADNLLVLCWRCHRALHQAEERAARVKGLAPR